MSYSAIQCDNYVSISRFPFPPPPHLPPSPQLPTPAPVHDVGTPHFQGPSEYNNCPSDGCPPIFASSSNHNNPTGAPEPYPPALPNPSPMEAPLPGYWSHEPTYPTTTAPWFNVPPPDFVVPENLLRSTNIPPSNSFIYSINVPAPAPWEGNQNFEPGIQEPFSSQNLEALQSQPSSPHPLPVRDANAFNQRSSRIARSRFDYWVGYSRHGQSQRKSSLSTKRRHRRTEGHSSRHDNEKRKSKSSEQSRSQNNCYSDSKSSKYSRVRRRSPCSGLLSLRRAHYVYSSYKITADKNEDGAATNSNNGTTERKTEFKRWRDVAAEVHHRRIVLRRLREQI